VENMRPNYIRNGEVISGDFEDWAKYTIQEMYLKDVCSTCNEPIDPDNWTWVNDKNRHEAKIILECDECGDLIFEIYIPIDIKEEE
jgi:RNase P subunit RPR2